MASQQGKAKAPISVEDITNAKSTKNLKDMCFTLLKSRDEMFEQNKQTQALYIKAKASAEEIASESKQNAAKIESFEQSKQKISEITRKGMQTLNSNDASDDEKLSTCKEVLSSINNEFSNNEISHENAPKQPSSAEKDDPAKAKEKESSKIRKITEENERLSKELETAKRALAQKSRDHDKSQLEKKYNFQVETNKKALSELSELRKENNDLKRKIVDYGTIRSSVMDNSSTPEEQRPKSFRKSLYPKTPSMATTSSRTSRASSRKSSVKGQAPDVSDDSSSKRAELSKEEQELIKQKEKEAAQYQETVVNLHHQLKDARSRMNDLKTSIDKAKEDNRETVKNIAELLAKTKAATTKLEQQSKKQQREAQKEISQLKETLAKAQKEMQEAETKNNEVREQLIKKRKEYDEELQKSVHTKQKIQARVDLFEKQISEVSAEITRLRQVNKEGKKKLADIEKSISDGTVEISKKRAHLQSSIEARNKLLAKKQEELRKIQSENKKLDKQIAENENNEIISFSTSGEKPSAKDFEESDDDFSDLPKSNQNPPTLSFKPEKSNHAKKLEAFKDEDNDEFDGPLVPENVQPAKIITPSIDFSGSDDDFSDLPKAKVSTEPVKLVPRKGLAAFADGDEEFRGPLLPTNAQPNKVVTPIRKSNAEEEEEDDEFSDLPKANVPTKPISLKPAPGVKTLNSFAENGSDDNDFNGPLLPSNAQPNKIVTPIRKSNTDEEDDDDFSDLPKANAKPATINLSQPPAKKPLNSFADEDDEEVFGGDEPANKEPIKLFNDKKPLDSFRDDDDDDEFGGPLVPSQVQPKKVFLPEKKNGEGTEIDDDDDFSDLPRANPSNKTISLNAPQRKSLDAFADDDNDEEFSGPMLPSNLQPVKFVLPPRNSEDDDDFTDLPKAQPNTQPISIKTRKKSLGMFKDEDDEFSKTGDFFSEEENQPLTIKASVQSRNDTIHDVDDLCDALEKESAQPSVKFDNPLTIQQPTQSPLRRLSSDSANDDDDDYVAKPKAYHPPSPSNDPNLLKMSENQDIDGIFGDDSDDQSPLMLQPAAPRATFGDTLPRKKQQHKTPKQKIQNATMSGTLKPEMLLQHIAIAPNKTKSKQIVSYEIDSDTPTEVNIAEMIKSIPDDIKKSPETPIAFDKEHSFNYRRMVSSLKKHNKAMKNIQMENPAACINDQDINDLFDEF